MEAPESGIGTYQRLHIRLHVTLSILYISYRLQSTLVNILNIFGFRHNYTLTPKGTRNSLCSFIDKCNKELKAKERSYSHGRSLYRNNNLLKNRPLRPIDHIPSSRYADISIQHQICNMNGSEIQRALPCAFRSQDDLSFPIKQITLVREPVARAVSVYYFWGELGKLSVQRSRGSSVQIFL